MANLQPSACWETSSKNILYQLDRRGRVIILIFHFSPPSSSLEVSDSSNHSRAAWMLFAEIKAGRYITPRVSFALPPLRGLGVKETKMMISSLDSLEIKKLCRSRLISDETVRLIEPVFKGRGIIMSGREHATD